MRFLQLTKHLIPVLNIFRIEVEEEDGEEEQDGEMVPVIYENVFIHMKDGTVVAVEEESFEDICKVLNQG
jgi:hypothetical protein